MKHSLRTKVLIIFICMTFAIVIFSDFVLYMSLNKLELSRASREQQSSVKAAADKLNDIISAINSCGAYAMLDKDLSDYVHFNSSDPYLRNLNENKINKKYSDLYSINLDGRLKKHAKTFFINSKLSKNTLFLKGNTFILQSETNISIYTSEGVENEEWFLETKRKNGTIHVFEKNGIMCVSQLIKDETRLGNHDEYLGVSLIAFDLDSFLKELTNSTWDTSAAIKYNNRIILKTGGGDEMYINGNSKKYIKSRAEAYAGIEFITLTEKGSVKMGYADSGGVILLNIVVTFILGIILSLWLSRIITKPINVLANQMRKIKKDNINTLKLNYASNDELGEIYNSFNDMLTKLSELMLKAESDAEEKKELEIRLYQNRINPHFLYNTLDCISWSALMNGNNEICKMNKMLSEIYRYSVGGKDFMAKMSEEIEHISRYAELQKLRLGKEINIEFDGKELFDKINIPKCTLQPLLENSVLHGMSEDMEELKIYISAEVDGGDIKIIFSDNGTGCDAETVNRYINSDADAESIGLRNVSQRIKLRCGNGYGLRVCENNSNGTRIIIKLPVKGGMEE